MIRLLHQPERLDADLAAGRMDFCSIEVRIDFGRHSVLDAHSQQIGSGHALVAIGRDGAFDSRPGGET